MEKTRRGQEDYPVVKTTQYLTGLTTSQDVWSEVGRALCSFFGADVVAFGERRADGEITTHHWTFLDPDFGETLSSAVEPPGQADVDQSGIGAEIKAAIAETLECGFLTSRLISTPESASIAFLPLIRENQVAAVMLVGHRTAEPLPKELLNVYLAVASLVGTTTARIASERELRKHRQHLETLIQQRTAELTQVNEQLQQEIIQRQRAEERVAHLNRVLRSIRDVNQLIVRETDPDRLIQGACDNLIKTRGYHNAWIALFDESGELRATAEAGLGEGFSPLVEQFERGELPVCGQRALAQSGVVVIQDPPSSCTACPLAANYGGRGAMTARLEHGETYYGLLTVSIPAHLTVDEEEQDLLQEVADDLAFAVHDIRLEEERRRGEQALRESEKAYRRLIETLNEGIWRIDAEGHTTFVNPKMAEMLGHTVEEMEGEHLFAFMDDEWVEEAQDKLKRRQQGVTEVHEFTFRKKSGESAHMLLSTSSIFDERGEYAGALAGVTDITQRKRAEANVARTAEALRESEAVLNEAQEIAGVGSFVWDLRTDALRWSRHMFTIAGLDPDAFYANLQDTINNMIHPDDRASVQQQIAAMVEQKRTWPMEFRLVRPDGDVRWLRSGSRFTFDEQGTPIECIGVHHDVTERKRAEEERARLTARVHEQAQQMAQVLATVPTGVVLLDAQGRILQANPTAEKDLVVLARANVGDVLTRLGKRPLAELLTPPPARGLWHEVKVNERTFEIIAQPVENGPQPKQWVLVINDATQEREIRAQLQQQERLAAVGQLAAGIAHDFNNIMAAIILYAQMAARSETLPQRDRERMAVIDQQARHATRLIEQILDFSRRAMLERQPLDLLPLLKEQVKLLKRTLPEHIGIEMAYGHAEYTVDADPTRLQQMLTNLAVNARDAMPDGGTLRIGLERIAVEPGPSSPLPEAAPGDWIRLTVSDTGTGIPADALPHIFEPFFTTKGPGEGSGLGLAQVHGIVGQHGGRVDVESQIGEGTTFVIYLPALEARPVEPSPTDAPIPPRGQGQVVLIVEDEGAVRTALVASLEQWNYRTLEATNGEEALDVMERQGGQVSLVLSDVVMPEMGGIALFRALRERGRWTPVILLTGHPMDKKDLDELWGQGLSACLTKPPNIERLAQAVADALQT